MAARRPGSASTAASAQCSLEPSTSAPAGAELWQSPAPWPRATGAASSLCSSLSNAGLLAGQPIRGFAASAACPAAAYNPPRQPPRVTPRRPPPTPSAPLPPPASPSSAPASSPPRPAPPLLRHPPGPTAVPLPTLAACPTVDSLTHHLDTLGYRYRLAHASAGLQTLASLAPHGPRSGPSTPSSSPSSPSPTAGPNHLAVESVARRLAQLAAHLAAQETDVSALAGCLTALGHMSAAAKPGELAAPLVHRLRASSYYFTLRDAEPAVLVELLHATAKLQPGGRVAAKDRPWFGQVVGRIKHGLRTRLPELDGRQAAAVGTALVRLWTAARGSELNMGLLRGLASHVTDTLIPRGELSPDSAVRLLWAYGLLLPRPASPDQPLASASSASSASTSRSSTNPRSPARNPRAPPQPGIPASSTTGVGEPGTEEDDEAVAKLAAALCRVAARSLRALPPLELVKAVTALARLGAGEAAAQLLPQATPALLRVLSRLDNSALTDVAVAYASLRYSEPGLMAAIADQVVASGQPLSIRDTRLLTLCYGGAGTTGFGSGPTAAARAAGSGPGAGPTGPRPGPPQRHAALWSLLRGRLSEPGTLALLFPDSLKALLATLDLKDPGDAQLAMRIQEQLRLTSGMVRRTLPPPQPPSAGAA
ncbi:hypothetical protein HYH03_000919 [Edaphochlamys debaryana]|uniref:Uncharacterized protein n=1 Tax=Edaphochlamys debaryana TaxID=47281 RepID=A0A836C5D0_9CHLO|nr:hypothetical protein HYH03_000919 [Edaphochlamys debaryana]|eukprot:KAG2501101.1 hypothetical protein HYH03_000919 [Edaphochlamys debaryana]